MNSSGNERPRKDGTSSFLRYGEAGKRELKFQVNFSDVFEVLSSNDGPNFIEIRLVVSYLSIDIIQWCAWTSCWEINRSKQRLKALKSIKNTAKHSGQAFSNFSIFFCGFFQGILLSRFRFNFNSIQTLQSRWHGNLCHIRFSDLWCSWSGTRLNLQNKTYHFFPREWRS